MTKKSPALTAPAPNAMTTNRYHMPQTVFATPQRICNAASREPLKPSTWQPARVGADDFRRWPSKGLV